MTSGPQHVITNYIHDPIVILRLMVILSADFPKVLSNGESVHNMVSTTFLTTFSVATATLMLFENFDIENKINLIKS